MTVMIGIDPHKRTHTAVAIDERGAKLGELRIDASWQQVTSMLAWAEQFPDRRWAVEGAGGLGRPLAVGLVAAHEHVVDVPALLSARIRTLSGTPHKTDAHDARSGALAGRDHPDLRRVKLDDVTVELRLALTRRNQLVSIRQKHLCWVHEQLVVLVPGGAQQRLTPPKIARMLRTIAKNSGDPVLDRRRELVVSMLAELRRIDRKIAELNDELEGLLRVHGTRVRAITGIGAIGAATLVAVIGDATRFPTAAKFASFVGIAPIEASSGHNQRHRLNPGGNRPVKSVLHTAAMTQISRDTEGRSYYQRKRAQGRTHREAMRSLKRHIATRIWRIMIQDAHRGVGPGRTNGND